MAASATPAAAPPRRPSRVAFGPGVRPGRGRVLADDLARPAPPRPPEPTPRRLEVPPELADRIMLAVALGSAAGLIAAKLLGAL